MAATVLGTSHHRDVNHIIKINTTTSSAHAESLNTMPLEILLQIQSHLDLISLGSFSLTASKFHSASKLSLSLSPLLSHKSGLRIWMWMANPHRGPFMTSCLPPNCSLEEGLRLCEMMEEWIEGNPGKREWSDGNGLGKVLRIRRVMRRRWERMEESFRVVEVDNGKGGKSEKSGLNGEEGYERLVIGDGLRLKRSLGIETRSALFTAPMPKVN